MANLFSRSWHEYQLGWLVITLCIQQSLLLQSGGNNVVEREYYVQTSRKTGWFFNKKTVYSAERRVAYECRAGWQSNNDISCDYAICNGRTNLNGACNDYFGNSHIIYADGSVQYYPDGTCNTPGICTCRNQGFYSQLGSCQMCSAIANCNLEICTTGTDQTCSRCEGVVQERAGYRAYRVSTDRTACEKACSWRNDSTRCYPGTCSNELASACSCATGFTGQHCNTITAQANITYNELTLTSQDNTIVTVPPDVNGGPSAKQNDVWTNLQNLSNMTYSWTGQFRPSVPTYHVYITDFQVGVVGGSFKFVLYRDSATHQFDAACSGASPTNPNKDLFSCSSTILSGQLTNSFPSIFRHRDRIVDTSAFLSHADSIFPTENIKNITLNHTLDYSFSASVGGFVKVNNMESTLDETFYYTGNTKEHLFQLNFDMVPPYHCTISSDCSKSMLLVTDISRTAVQFMTWDGWQDDDAGIGNFIYHVFSLHEVGGVLRHKSSVAQGTVSATSSGNSSFTLSEPGMYAFVLTAQDRASNTKMSRRLFLYDATSDITTNQSTALRVTSSAPETAWTWQQTEGSVTVIWTNRYVNSFHHNNQLLAAVASEPGVSSDYDDNEGLRTLSAIPNVLGIVKFATAFKVDREGRKNMTTPSDNSFTLETNLNTTKTIPGIVTDGQSFTFWVRAYDVRGDYFQESVTVHVDSSPPVIENLWLTKDHLENISVHGLEDLDKMTIEWLAYDDHSGLESVRWRLVDNFNNKEIVHGAANVPPQGESENLEHCRSKYGSYARGPNCYCTGPVGCYHRHFQVNPGIIDIAQQPQGGIFSNASTGVHDYDYYIEVIVRNHAKLSSTLRKKISLDASPPAPGVVHDGMVGSPEVDFQSSRILRAYWSGFFDRESGVKFYQYAFHTACLDKNVFGHNTQDGRVFVTYETTATWTAPGEGKYYVTVVAFNNAIQPSSRVCSDGVTVDTSPPVVSQVDIENAHVPSGLVRGEGSDVWLIESNRRRRMVYKPDKACIDKATVLNLTVNVFPLHPIELFPLHPIAAPIPAVNACQQQAFDPRFSQSFYLSKDRLLYMNWTSDDPESGIHDYEVGLATTSDNTENPDLSPYTSTDHRAFYRVLHPSLTEGAPFYIFIRSTNRADVSSIMMLGPVLLIRKPSSYAGNVTLTLVSNRLVASWDLNLLTDVEPHYLKFSVALEEETSGATLQLHAPPRFLGNCVEARPPSCTTFDINDLDWQVHQKHTYFARVKITNIIGLDLHLTSQAYVHDTRLASRGTVFDVIPDAEEELLAVKRSEDADFQLSRIVFEGRWFGFEDETQPVTYWVAAGTQPGSDDIAKFLHVGTVNSFTFTNLKLQNETTYYFTVTAMTSSGNVTVSSDGVRIIRDNRLVEGVQIFDGPGCSSNTGNALPNNLTVPQHHADVLSTPCEEDSTFQMSRDKFAAHWALSNEQHRRYPDVQWKVQKAISGTNSWYDVTQYGPSSGPDSTTAEGLSLQAGGRYRAAVKFCVGNACSMPLFSSGVFVTSDPPVTGSIETSYKLSGNGSMVEVTFEMFKDADIKDFVAAKSVMVGYQWSLAEKGEVMRLFQPWQTVQDLKVINDTHSRFTAKFAGQLSVHVCLHLVIRGLSRLGLTSVLSTPVKDCRLTDSVLTVPQSVLDAVGETVKSGFGNEGSGVTLDLNAVWGQEDRDYTPHTNVISAVWPSVRHLNISWIVLASAGPEVKSHYFVSDAPSLQAICSSPLAIACGDVLDQKYINVYFGPNSGRPLLENGQHYYVCIHAESQNLTYEKWNEELPAISLCSDGVTVDTTPPQAGTVSIGGVIKGLYLTSLSVVNITWYGFNDIEALGLTPHHSGILRYHVAIGSSISGEDVTKFKDVGLVNEFTMHGLSLQNGHKYFITVKAEDHFGRFAETWNTIVVDSTPPARMTSQFLFPFPYLPSATVVSVCWKNMFRDEESGVVSYRVTLGSRPGQSDVMQSKEVFSECGDFTPERSLIEGHAYYFTVKAVNGANLQTTFSSHRMILMTTAPSLGHVFDGRPSNMEKMNIDADFTTSYDDIAAFWRGFATPLSPVTSYTVRLGTCPGCRDVVDDFDVGLMQEIQWNLATLSHGVRYYTTVTACNAIELCTEVTSDGILVDVMPPIAGLVWDGSGDWDISFQGERNYLASQWRGFQDLGSGLATFTWRVGTIPGGEDLMPERDIGLTFSAFTSHLSNPLPEGRHIYVTVTATDRAGNSVKVTSNGFIVDPSPPEVARRPNLARGLGTFGNGRLVSRDALSVTWQFQDPESGVELQYISLSSHLLGDFSASLTQIPGHLTEYTFTKLSLHDGNFYKVKVTACNRARLCSTSESENFLLDSSPPSTGMFAVNTDHAADLQRHIDGWMQWTGDTLRLAWLGFRDIHSGVEYYTVSVGSSPFDKDFLVNDTYVGLRHEDSGITYQDEGFVQTHEVATKDLAAGKTIYIAVWAVNGVGLKSHPAVSQFDLEDGGGLSLRRRCLPYNCLSHCACAVQGGTCGATSSCTLLTKDNTTNTSFNVYDHVDLRVLESQTSPLTSDAYTPSGTVLAGTWSVPREQEIKPVRFEVTVGRSSEDNPNGVFVAADDRMWLDVGIATSAVITLPQGRSLIPKLSYSIFLRAWYSDDSFAIFKSPGIIPLVQAPMTTNQFGRSVKEHGSVSEEKDVDYVTTNSSVFISWKGKFLTTSGPIQRFNVYIGSIPGGNDIHISSDLPGTSQTYQAVNLTLVTATFYFTSVTAFGSSGLLTSAVSDGFLLDTRPPTSGLVLDGLGLHDFDYQSRDDHVSSTWHGFSDVGGGIRRYFWCIGLTPRKDECDVRNWTDVGLSTNSSASQLKIPQGTLLFNKVYAEDSVGHKSNVSVSDGVIIDTTPPVVQDVVYTDVVNLLDNPSFEADIVPSVRQMYCNSTPPSSWQLTPGSCVILQRPSHAISSDGAQHVLVSGGLQQTVRGLTEGNVYRLTVRLAYPDSLQAHHRPVDGVIQLGTEKHAFQLEPSMCRGVCDTGLEPLIMWHSYTYTVRAPSSTMTVIVSTTVTSSDQQMAVDHVILEEIRYTQTSANGSRLQPSATAVFLPHWSTVQMSWHFLDDVSPIVDNQWALGTVPGGVQIQGFKSVGKQQHATLSGLLLQQGTPLYVTVVTRNAAGLTSVSSSLPLLVDMTPPNITNLVDGLNGDHDVNYQTSHVVSATWRAQDNESDVSRCLWAIGYEPGRGDLSPFENVLPRDKDSYQATKNITSILSYLPLPQSLFVTVRCFNKAGLPGQAFTDGVTIVTDNDTLCVEELQLPSETVTQYSARDSCHVTPDRLRLRWDSVTSGIPVSGFHIAFESNRTKGAERNPNLPYLLHKALLEDVPFENNTVWDIRLSPVTVLNTECVSVNTTIRVSPDPPVVRGGKQLNWTLSGSNLVLAWPDLFSTSWSKLDLRYEVTVGSVRGGGDLALLRETRDTELVVSLVSARNRPFAVSYTVTAVDPCGYYVTHSGSIVV